MRQDIVICGVGGQGTILASRLIAYAAISAGQGVRTAETIGMAQRGGSVLGYIRLFDPDDPQAPQAPVVGPAQADLLIAFEPAEAARNLHLLKPGGTLVCSSHPIKPVQGQLSKDPAAAYDVDKIIDWLHTCADASGASGANPAADTAPDAPAPNLTPSSLAPSTLSAPNPAVIQLLVVDTAAICESLGSSKVLNVVLLGAALSTKALAISEAELTSAVQALVPARMLDLNMQALHAYQLTD